MEYLAITPTNCYVSFMPCLPEASHLCSCRMTSCAGSVSYLCVFDVSSTIWNVLSAGLSFKTKLTELLSSEVSDNLKWRTSSFVPPPQSYRRILYVFNYHTSTVLNEGVGLGVSSCVTHRLMAAWSTHLSAWSLYFPHLSSISC